MKTKKIEGKYIYRGICMTILTAIAAGMFFYTWYTYVRVHNQTGHLLGYANLLMALFIYVIVYLWLGKGLRAFMIGVDRKSNVFESQILTLVTTDILEIFISIVITGQFRFFWDFLLRYFLMFLLQAVVIGFLVMPMITIYRKVFPPLQVIEICRNSQKDFFDKLNSRPDKYSLTKAISYHDGEDAIRQEIKPYDAVLIYDLPSHVKNAILKICFEQDKRVYFVPKISDVIIKSSEELNLFDTPIFLYRNNRLSWMQALVKRFFDIILSLIAIIVLSPLLLVTAIAIHLEDHGPVFFRQQRCTINGEKFMIIKFRSMIVDAEKDGKSHPAGAQDDRITKVGQVIRATRIDELPQLFNILYGEMSIVGPRPERVEHVHKYTSDIPEFAFRQKMKGGLTGYAQVYGKYNTTALDKLKLDLYYIMNYSFLLDVQIIFETVKVIFQKNSTEGFDQEKQREMHDYDLHDKKGKTK